MKNPREHLAAQLRQQARACEAMGSPMYADLLDEAARDTEQGGVCFEVLKDHVLPGRGEAVALRFMAAVHRLVLEGVETPLRNLYPDVAGEPYEGGRKEEYWAAFHETLVAHKARVKELVHHPCQTNEVGRCAALIGGFLEVAHRSGLPLRLLEVGSSAGLNLRWDQYYYRVGEKSFGPEDSPVQLTAHWTSAPAHLGAAVEIAERRGCDLRPIDPTSKEGSLRVRASVWADQVERMKRLEGAIEIARRVPVEVEVASLDQWLEKELDEPREGVATVVFHAIVEEYLSQEVRRRFYETLQRAGERATPQAPFAHLRLEAISALRHHGAELTFWPGGKRRVIAKSGAHGQDVRWC